MLEPLGLDFAVRQGELIVTTRDVAAKKHPGLATLQQALPNLKQVYVEW
jgi:hypothetical protein